jgi:hypothetical protein
MCGWDLTIEVLKNLPPSASLEEIMYRVNLAAQVPKKEE